jgi:hypothetical protein
VIPDILKESLLFLSLLLGIIRRTDDHNFWELFLMMTIWRNGDRLVWQAFGGDALPGALDVYPESETNFFLKINGAQLTFIKNDKGEVTPVIHHRAGLPDSEGKKLKNE